MKEKFKERWVYLVIFLCIGIISFTFLANVTTNPQLHAKSIESLDEKRDTVLKLTAATTATSVLITMLPDDWGTPIAEKITDIGESFMWVLCAILIEKYLLSVVGYIAFKGIVPIAMILAGINLFVEKDAIRKVIQKLVIFALAIVLIIPISVKVTDIIDSTYEESIQSTITEAEDISRDISYAVGETDESYITENEAESEEENKENEKSGNILYDLADGVGEFISNATEKVTETVSGIKDVSLERVEKTVNNFVEAAAVMIVTSCVIPILVILFFVWLVKILLGLDFQLNFRPMSFRKAIRR